MQKARLYTISKCFIEGGKKMSFALPVDCTKVLGVFILPQFPDLPTPQNKPFRLGTFSMLLNNRNENTLHDYPLYCYPDAAGKMSVGDDYSLFEKQIKLATEVQPGSLVSFIYKDSNYMRHYKDSLPEFAGFEFDMDVNLIYK